LLNNDQCDPECNLASCDWDNGKCDGPVIVLRDNKEYDEDIQYERDPFIVSGAGAFVLIGAGICKVAFFGGLLNLFAISILGVIEFAG